MNIFILPVSQSTYCSGFRHNFGKINVDLFLFMFFQPLLDALSGKYVCSSFTVLFLYPTTCTKSYDMCAFAGLWWGYNIGLAVQNICLIIFVARLDWQAEAINVSLGLLLFQFHCQ